MFTKEDRTDRAPASQRQGGGRARGSFWQLPAASSSRGRGPSLPGLVSRDLSQAE